MECEELRVRASDNLALLLAARSQNSELERELKSVKKVVTRLTQTLRGAEEKAFLTREEWLELFRQKNDKHHYELTTKE